MSEESSAKRTRASGEVLEYLLREFELNHNPTPDQRKEISERTNMSEKAVRIWFQNRRAKLRKFERLGKPVKTTNGRPFQSSSVHTSRSNLITNISSLPISLVPVELNEKYCFVDCLLLSVGSWQRIKSGHHDEQALQTALVNLSPFTVNTVMTSVDLTVILLRKNYEINYFFSAISNNSKILFRIFYPLSSVLLCLLMDNNINKEDNELRLSLSRKPKFLVYFFNGVNANLNQWLICDDFSEGQQVSLAFFAPGGSSTPHVLVGVKSLLQFLNSFISENIQMHQAGFAPSVPSSDTPTDFQPSHDVVSSKDYIGMDDAHGNGDFQIKHELPSWEETPRSDMDFGHTNYHDRSNSEASEKPVDQKYASLHQEPKKDYEEMFGTHTPDFFTTVQTPLSVVLNAHTDEDHLINSPSTNVHSFGIDKNRSPRETPSRFALADALFTPNFGVNDHLYSHAEQPYDMDLQQQGEFQPNDLIVNSPALSNAAATPNTGNHVDNFIDYNAHY